MVVGLIGAVSLTAGSIPKAIGMILVGIVLGLVGTDVTSGAQRFTFGDPQLWDGIDFIVIAVGVFAFGEVVSSLTARRGPQVLHQPCRVADAEPRGLPPDDPGDPARHDDRQLPRHPARRRACRSPRSSPTAWSGRSRASATSWARARSRAWRRRRPRTTPRRRRRSSRPSTLGIPGSPTMALMLGAMIMHNIQPGPQVMSSNPELFWGLIVSMWIGNADPRHPQPAAGRALGEAPEDPVPGALPGDPALLLPRRLRHRATRSSTSSSPRVSASPATSSASSSASRRRWCSASSSGR